MGFVPPLYPYYIKTVGLSTGLSSIKMNMFVMKEVPAGTFFHLHRNVGLNVG